MPCRADALLLGVLVALILRTPAHLEWVEKHGRALLGLMAVLLGGALVSISHAALDSDLAQTVGYTWIALLYAAGLLYVLTQRTSILAGALRLEPLRAMGRVAYAVYLLHSLVIHCVSRVLSPHQSIRFGFPAIDSWSHLGLAFVALAITLLLSQISWKYLERPLIQIGHNSKYDFGNALNSRRALKERVIRREPDASYPRGN